MANVYGFDPTAWSIDGARHRGELLRLLAYAATSGAEGIVSPGDCKVHALSTPGSQVAVDTGGLIIRNRSANVRNQSYVANGRTETRLDVAPTGTAGGRTDLVVVRIEDPQYSPWATPPVGEAADYRYVKPFIIENVPASTRSATELNLGYSAVALSRITIPANTSTITDAYITDLRKLARPRTWIESDVQSGATNAQGGAVNLVSTDWTDWPANSYTFDVPDWTTHGTAKLVVNNVPIMGAVDFETRVVFTSGNITRVSYTGKFDFNSSNVDGSRVTLTNYWKFYMAEFAGKTTTMKLQARRVGAASGTVGIGSWEQVSFDLHFAERVV